MEMEKVHSYNNLLFSQAQSKMIFPYLTRKPSGWRERKAALAPSWGLEPAALRLVRGALMFLLPPTHPPFFFFNLQSRHPSFSYPKNEVLKVDHVK